MYRAIRSFSEFPDQLNRVCWLPKLIELDHAAVDRVHRVTSYSHLRRCHGDRMTPEQLHSYRVAANRGNVMSIVRHVITDENQT